MSRPLLVTSALPYASGPPHFGHLVGAYLPADLFVRYHRLIGTDVVYICGTDEHGTAILLAAEKEGVSPQELVDRWWGAWKESCERLSIEFDNFSQTSRKDPHYPLAQEFFLRLLANGRLVRKDIQQLYSPKTNRFLADRYVRGTCYLCGHEEARGNECQSCGSWLEAEKLGDPWNYVDRDDRLELRDSWQYELALDQFPEDTLVKPWLERFREGLKPNVRTFVFKKMIEGEGLESRPITRDLPWGVPVPATAFDGSPIEDVDEKVLYVWFDAPIGYVSSTIEWAKEHGRDWRRYWIRKRDGGDDEGPRLIHFIGKDNIPFHCVVFPAMLAWQTMDAPPDGLTGPAADEEYVLPENVPANEFFNLEGRKFNKSTGWTIDVRTFLDRYDADLARYYLISSMPETADSDFLWRDFKARTDELNNVVGNFVTRVVKFVAKYFDGKVPPLVGYEDEAAAVHAFIETRCTALGREVEAYQFRKALAEFRGLADDGNGFLNQTEPWQLRKTDMEACGSALHLALQVIPPLSVLAAPFVPGIAARMRAMVNLPERPASPLLPAETLPAGHQLGEPGQLCAKIDDDLIAADVAALPEAGTGGN